MANMKDMDVDVFITKDGSPPDGFKFGFGPDKKNKLEFKNEKHPGVVVYFNINPDGDAGLLFQPNPANALRVDNPPGGKQLVPLSVEQDGKQLIAYCRNLVVEQFKFTLGFVQNGGPPVDWDPIGDGLNGLRS